MKRILTISDIHGELAKLERLLDQVKYDPNQDQLTLEQQSSGLTAGLFMEDGSIA